MIKHIYIITPEEGTEVALINQNGTRMTEWVKLTHRSEPPDQKGEPPFVGYFADFAEHMTSYGTAVAYDLREDGYTYRYGLDLYMTFTKHNAPIELRIPA